VALVRSVAPNSVVEESCAPFVALKRPLIVEEPVMAREEEVPLWRLKERPLMRPTLLMENSVEVENVAVVEPMVNSWVVVVERVEVGVAKMER
jgi:hypothetical protein